MQKKKPYRLLVQNHRKLDERKVFCNSPWSLLFDTIPIYSPHVCLHVYCKVESSGLALIFRVKKLKCINLKTLSQRSNFLLIRKEVFFSVNLNISPTDI